MTAGDEVRALVCGYPQKYRGRKLLVALQAYIDDSASDIGDRRYYLAGLINTADKWADFSDEWAAELASQPAISYFRNVEAQNYRGPFKGWTRKQRVYKLERLASVAARYRPWTFEVSLNRREFDRIYKPNTLHALSHPFQICFVLVMEIVARLHETEKFEVPVDFIFDETKGLGDLIIIMFDWIKDYQPHWRNALGSTPVFRDDKKIMPLQAADMLAWHLRRESEKRDPKNYHAPLKILRRAGHAKMEVPNQLLEEWGAKFAQLPNLAEMQKKSYTKKTKIAYAERKALGLGPPVTSPEIEQILKAPKIKKPRQFDWE